MAEAPSEMATLTRREPGEVILELNGIGVHYGAVVDVDDVTIAVREGEILGLIGPNRAGKTTFIDGISGYTRAPGPVSLRASPLDGRSPHQPSLTGLGRQFPGLRNGIEPFV